MVSKKENDAPSLLLEEPCKCGSLQKHLEQGIILLADFIKKNDICGESILITLEFAKLAASRLLVDNMKQRHPEEHEITITLLVAEMTRNVEMMAIDAALSDTTTFVDAYEAYLCQVPEGKIQ